MARDYENIHYIQGQLEEFNSTDLTKSVIRVFEKICTWKWDDACVYATVMLHAIFKYFGVDSNITYGITSFNTNGYEYKFYHAWLEANDKILDLAIFGNINYSHIMRNMHLEKPVVNETYQAAESNNITYKRFEVDEGWKTCKIAVAENETIHHYFNHAPQDFWQHLCSYVGISGTPKNISKLKEITRDEVIFPASKEKER